MPIHVLFVCLGNICRSPMAEVVFEEHVRQAGLTTDIRCDSAGTANYHTGGQADARTRQVARHHELNVTHRARQLNHQDFQHFDYIVAMDRNNLKDIQYVAQKVSMPKAQLLMMRQFESGELLPPDVPDPYYEDEAAFEEMYHMLWRASEALLTHIRQNHRV